MKMANRHIEISFVKSRNFGSFPMEDWVGDAPRAVSQYPTPTLKHQFPATFNLLGNAS